MAEKRLSGEEQRAKMKEAYKDDLRKRKQFLEDVKEHNRVKTLSDAVINITSANENDDTDVWVEKLNEKSALSEAKMEMALDSANVSSSPIADERERLALSDAEIRKLKAAELVAQMKAEMLGQSQPQTNAEPPKVELKKEVAPESKPLDPESGAALDDRPARKMLEDI
jgi:phage shock protein A